MNNLNSIIIEGNLTRDAELKEPSSGFKLCSFSVGVNRWFKNANGEGQTEVSYFDCEAYGKLAEDVAKSGIKGRGVRIVGRLKQNRWIDAEGKALSHVYVICEHIEFKPIKKEEEIKQ